MRKKYIISKAQSVVRTQDPLNDLYFIEAKGSDFSSNQMQVSDGYHTMDELYEHRFALWIALCRQIATGSDPYASGPTHDPIWRSKLHDDGSEYEGWFVLGIGKKKGKMMTYHLPNIKWDDVSFAETLERAPEYDGHTSNDVLNRLKNL